MGTVLVVEDEPSVREMTTRHLERAGYEVLAVRTARRKAAVDRPAEPFDVLVTDVIMPNMSGIELAERMMDASRCRARAAVRAIRPRRSTSSASRAGGRCSCPSR